MKEKQNVGSADQVIRIILGFVCVGLLVYHFAVDAFLPLYALIPVIILVPFFLKTGYTKVCPVMKALNVSTAGKDLPAEDTPA